MDYQDIVNEVAPCGLNCRKCLFRVDGDIRQHSAMLKSLLGNFGPYAERFSKMNPLFEDYQAFDRMLAFFTTGDCSGCRSGECRYHGCRVASCVREREIDFCFQCDEFPCEHSNLDDDLKKRWISMNLRMKEIGTAAYYDRIQTEPRYP